MLFPLNNVAYGRFKASFCLCISLTVFSLYTIAQPANDWYLNKILNDNNGLPQNSVASMYLDKITGFLWMTTEAGLVRYDGINTRVFDVRDFPSLKTTRMWYLFPTVHGEILACTRLGEVLALKNNYVTNKAGDTATYYYQNGNARSIGNLNFETKIAKHYADKFSALTYSVWLNDSIWVALSGSHIGIFKHEQLSNQWPVQKGIYALVVRNNFIYVINKDASSFCINLDNKTLNNTNAASKVLIEGKPVVLYDKLNDQPLLLNNDSLYELHFNKNTISAKFIVTLKNLPTDIASIIIHPDKRFVFVSTNTTGVYIYRLSPFRVYKSSANAVNNMGIDLNNNYATLLIDSNYIFTSRSLLLNLATGNFTKVSLFNTQLLSLGLDSSKKYMECHRRWYKQFPGTLAG